MKKILFLSLFLLQIAIGYAQSNIVLFDVSGSMDGINGEKILPKAKSQLISFVNSLDSAEITVIPFTDKVFGQYEGKDFISSPIIKRRGNTNILKALNYLPKVINDSVKSVFLLSDGLQTTGQSVEQLSQSLNAIKNANKNNYYYFVALTENIKTSPLAAVFDSVNNFILLDSLYIPTPNEKGSTCSESQVTNIPSKKFIGKTITEKSKSFNFYWWWLLIALILILLVIKSKGLLSWLSVSKTLPNLKEISDSTEEVEEEKDPFKSLRKGSYKPLADAPKTTQTKNPDGSITYSVPGTNTSITKRQDGTFVAKSGCNKGAENWAPNHALDRPEPNAKYEIPNDKIGAKIDSEGRTKYVEQELNEDTINKERPNLDAQRREGIGLKPHDGLDASHILGKQMGGPNENINLIPMIRELQEQGSDWANYENKEASITRNFLKENPGKKLIRTREIEYYPGTKYPQKITCRLFDPSTGKVLQNRDFDFPKP